MMQTKFKTAYALSIIIGILMVVQSGGELLIRGMYRINAWVKSTWYGNDVVTLTVAVPVLITALIFSKRGSVRSQLVWLGVLFYSFYNYAFYLFGAAILLWIHQPWGYVPGTMVMISGTLYMLVLIAYSPFGEHADVAGAWDMFFLYGRFWAQAAWSLLDCFSGIYNLYLTQRR